MRRILPLLLAISILVGIGCSTPPDSQTANNQSANVTQKKVENLLGLVHKIDTKQNLATIVSPDSSFVDVRFSKEHLADLAVGDLIRYSGTQDRSTRFIEAKTFFEVEDPSIIVTSPKEAASVTSPLVVFGFARTTEGVLNWRIYDGADQVVLTGIAASSAAKPDAYGPFRFEIFLPAFSGKAFSLELFTRSSQDGSEMNLVRIPLERLSEQTKTINLFFPNGEKGSFEDCRAVFSVEREIATTSAIARAAIFQLLAGPTQEEVASGYQTSLPDGLQLESISIRSGVAHVDFSSHLKQMAGSCLVQSARAQITQTLLQFSSVEEVEITVNGLSEEVLQP